LQHNPTADATVIWQDWRMKQHTLWCLEATAHPSRRAVETSLRPPTSVRYRAQAAVAATPRHLAWCRLTRELPRARSRQLGRLALPCPTSVVRCSTVAVWLRAAPHGSYREREKNEEKERKKATGRDKEEGKKERKMEKKNRK
jgi:hypothetical protein